MRMHALLVRLALVASICLFAVACENAPPVRVPSKYKITMYSYGQKKGEWLSARMPIPFGTPDGWTFRNLETGHVMVITGDVVIESLD